MREGGSGGSYRLILRQTRRDAADATLPLVWRKGNDSGDEAPITLRTSSHCQAKGMPVLWPLHLRNRSVEANPSGDGIYLAMAPVVRVSANRTPWLQPLCIPFAILPRQA